MNDPPALQVSNTTTTTDNATPPIVSSRSRLPELRASLRVSDGASKRLSATAEAQSLSIRRGSSKVKHRGGLETYITCLIEDLRYSLTELNATGVTDRRLEDWAILIHGCLSVDTRSFHSVHHVFEISGGCDAIQLLAACFRDTISYSTDGQLTKKQEELVAGVVEHSARGPKLLSGMGMGSGGHSSSSSSSSSSPTSPSSSSAAAVSSQYCDEDDEMALLVVMDVFGLTPGQMLGRYPGLDVFLSAVLTTRVFRKTLTLAQLVQIVTCMEATIAFRPPVNGETALERLYRRLQEVTDKFELDLSEDDIVKTIQRATDLSNRNLGNFASHDATVFLDHTWSLLPERSDALRRSFLYTVNDMLLATRDMERMMTDIEAGRIFQSFRGVPEEDEMDEFHQQTNQNLTKGRTYLRAKLLSICVLSGFAVVTGGDTPMSFFCGDLGGNNSNNNSQSTTPTIQEQQDTLSQPPSPPLSRSSSPLQSSQEQQRPNRLGASLPVFSLDEAIRNGCDMDVYQIMTGGRKREQVFDHRDDPLASFFYAQLGDEGVRKALAKCSFPMHKFAAKALLKHLPAEAVKMVGYEIGKIALTRTEGIHAFLETLP